MSTTSICYSMTSIPFLSLTPHTTTSKLFTKRNSYTPRSSFSSSSSSCSLPKRVLKNGVGLWIKACSTSPYIGRVGSQWREGNSSLLSFGTNPSAAISKEGAESSDDSSQLLSAMLPFVVAATAVAALAQPSTFTWWVLFS